MVASLCAELDFHLSAIGDLRGALPYSQSALAIREKALGPDHDNEALLQATATSLNNLAWLFYNERDLVEAVRLMRRVVDILGRTIPNHANTQTAHESLAFLEAQLGREQDIAIGVIFVWTGSN
jgi:tetratricopeptide (TPR) repeat protein